MTVINKMIGYNHFPPTISTSGTVSELVCVESYPYKMHEFKELYSAQFSNAVVWKFETMKHDLFDQTRLTDPDDLYLLNLSSDEIPSIFSLELKCSDVKHLFGYFGVQDLSGLNDKSFTCPSNHVELVIDYFITMQKQSGKYRPPIYQDIYQLTTTSLVNMNYPDFSDIDRYTIFLAFRSVFKTDFIRENWIQDLQASIDKLSHGQVKLIRDENPPSNSDSDPADCFVLTKGSQRLRFAINRNPYHKRPFKSH